MTARTASRRRRLVACVVAFAALALAVAAGIAVGSAALPLDAVWGALVHPDDGIAHATVGQARVQRTILGLLVGASLGVAGALIQAVTRNPLADPGILGVNAGAGFAVVLAVAVLGVTRIEQFLPFAFVGAIAATVVVSAIAAAGGPPTPLRLTLVGVAVGAVLMGVSQTLALIDVETFDRMRFWGVGTIADRPGGTIEAIWPFVALGLVLALVAAQSLNAVALGDDLARAVGARIGAARAVAIVAITLLCGAATAAAGPIGFVGLMVPHLVRLRTGPDQRWIVALSAVGGAVLVLGADVLGRIVAMPIELQVGVVTAFLGAPALIVAVRRSRAVAL